MLIHEHNFSLSAIKAIMCFIFRQRHYVLYFITLKKKNFMCLLGHVLIKMSVILAGIKDVFKLSLAYIIDLLILGNSHMLSWKIMSGG